MVKADAVCSAARLVAALAAAGQEPPETAAAVWATAGWAAAGRAVAAVGLAAAGLAAALGFATAAVAAAAGAWLAAARTQTGSARCREPTPGLP
eukprot:360750-Chlamydomonas_euryale.AAC.5